MSFELLSDQRKVRKRINSKIHSVYKMQPVCRLEALSHVRGGTSALETGWSSLGRGTGRSIQAPGPLWTLCLPVSRLTFLCSDWLPGALFSVSFWGHSSCLLVLICVVLGFLFNTYTQLPSCSDSPTSQSLLTCSKLRLVSPFKPSLIR